MSAGMVSPKRARVNRLVIASAEQEALNLDNRGEKWAAITIVALLSIIEDLTPAADEWVPGPCAEKPAESYRLRDIQHGLPISLDGRGRKDTYLLSCKLCGAFIPTNNIGASHQADMHVAWHNKCAQ